MASTHISRVSVGGVNNRAIAPSLYMTCSTAKGTAAKTITNTGATWASADLFAGLTIFVKFTNENTSSSPTLNIDSTGAKPIYRYGTTVPGTSASVSWQANSVIGLTYDTTLNSNGCWVMHGWLNDTYSAMSQSEATTGTSTTARTITAKVLNDTIDAKISASGSVHSVTPTKATIGSASTGTAIAADDITAYTAGTAASLTTSSFTVPNVTGVGTKPSLTVTSTACDDITGWTTNTPTTPMSAAVSNGVLTLTDGTAGTAASLSYTARSVGSASNWSAGSTPTLGTAFSIKGVDVFTANTPTSVTYTARSIPNITVTDTEVVTDITTT